MNKLKLTPAERSWVLYDVGNSAFTLLIATIIPIYFNFLAEEAGLSNVQYLAYWGYAASAATLLVAVLGMGVAGAALATITSQLLSAVLVVLALMKTDDMYKLEWKKVRIDQRMLQRIVRIGIPAGMQSVMYNISNVIIQAGVNTLGTDNVTAWATYGKVDGLYWMMINALGISATTFVGQNFGAGRLDRVRKGAGACMVIGVVLTASVGVVLYNGGHLLVELFTTDQQVQAISMDLLHFMVPTFITYIAIEILSGTLRGWGRMDAPYHYGHRCVRGPGAVDYVCSASLPHHHRRCLLLSFDLEPDHGCLCYLLLLFQQSQTLEA